MAGYSATPLIKKLGIKPGYSILVRFEPDHYWDWISPLPNDVNVKSRVGKSDLDFAHLFVKDQKVFQEEFIRLKASLCPTGMLWVSWPKKSSKVDSDLDEGIIRSFGLRNGLVDVKVCAVDEVWSGLKFMFRLKDR